MQEVAGGTAGAPFNGTVFCVVPSLFPEGEVDICITLLPGGAGWGCISNRNRYLCNN